ncbi:cytochrome P450 [Actinomadura sp. LD22]|uniref:Cytochrome P450 n=1 Tax=Actinomadura physcomitrii TaxID=2650748 RepID=A0A6I4MDE8_9ACTN|nr:cytochrome P450 [Actinomadura physcomitrii]MWA02920.1 cytochrome P450 [Actinomadura physcomitrii]
MTPFPADGYDLFSPEFSKDPHRTYEAVRASACPVAHSDRLGGSWMPVRFDDIRSVARNPEDYSSRTSEITGPTVAEPGGGLLIPPITSDPPEHKAHRDLLMPWFTPKAVAARGPFVRAKAESLAAALAERGEGDLVADFAQNLTVATLARILGVPIDLQPTFIDWTVRMFRLGPLDTDLRARTVHEILGFFDGLLAERARDPRDDLLSHIATAEGDHLTHKHRLGSAFVILLAGADTTWSAIGAGLWHLGHHPADRDALAADRSLMDTAVEEILRYYAPVTVTRTATRDLTLCGRGVRAGDRVIAPFAAANRDPGVFEDADTLRLGRRRNRHLAFGTGAHRCIGSSLARLELKTALGAWLDAMPRFEVPDPGSVRWTSGAVRGPEAVAFVSG